MALDHVSIGVANVVSAKAFYDAVLAPLGMKPIMPIEQGGRLVGCGYGDAQMPTFWIQRPINRQPASVGNGAHVAFAATSRAAVDEFFLAALEYGGGVEDGRPGLRSQYHPNYYGAFVRDLDGNKIEACRHAPG